MMITLYPHQVEALAKSASMPSFAFLMPPGTGKTIVQLEEVRQLFRQKSVDIFVVICPKILLRQWEKATQEYYSSDIAYNVVIYKNYLRKYNYVHNCLNMFLLNIESFSRDNSASILLLRQLIATKKQILLCIDESSKMKNSKTSMTCNILEATKDISAIKYRRILTGAVVTESPMDFYTQFKFLDPAIIGFKSFFAFRHHYAELTNVYIGSRAFKKIKSFKYIDELVAKITPYCYLTRLKDIKGMPEKIFENVYVDLNTEQRRQYEKLKRESILELESNPIEELNVISAMDKLYKFFRILQGHYLSSKIINVKVAALRELFNLYDGKFLVFCRFVNDTDILMQSFGNEIAVIRGNVTDVERQKMISKFKDNSYKHLIMMQQIGSFGLDLPEVNYVVYFSCNFSYNQRIQGEARATRLSSKNNIVTYFNIIAENTIEERLYEILKIKEIMFINILNLLKGNS